MIWLLHGNLGAPSDWDATSRALARLLPGQEIRTPNLWKLLLCCPMSMQEAARKLNAEIFALDPAPVICGYSLGGRMLLHMLAAATQSRLKPAAAILVSTHTGLPDAGQDARNQRLESDTLWANRCLNLPWEEFLSAWNAQDVLASGPAHSAFPPDKSRFLMLHRKAIARAFVHWSLARQPDFLPLLGQLSPSGIPFTLAAGELDAKFAAIATSASRAHGLPLAILPACGHRIPFQSPDELARLIAATPSVTSTQPTQPRGNSRNS